VTTVTATDGFGNSASSTLDIIQDTGGKPNSLRAYSVGSLNRQYLASLERSSHYEVSLTASTLPYAVEIDFTHDADIDSGGVGRAYAVDPVSGIKTLIWSDDGSSMKVIMMPAKEGLIKRVQDFKFYIAGGVTNVWPTLVQAYDNAGNPVAGVNANVNFTPIALDDVP
jgi:hypothetical protein